MAKIEWISVDEKLEQELLESLKPTQEEIEKADFELKSINLLIELGVI